MNIDYTDTLNEVAGRIDISAMSAHDAADLITVAENALKLGARGVLAPVDLVHTIWAWLENKGVSIFASIDVKIKKGREFDYVNLVQKISNVFKKGADGVVLMTEPGIVAELLSELNPVRGDLFFGKKLIIGFDLNDVNAHDWPGIFHEMRNIFADGLLL
ncbi:MAG: hypothetical protein FWG18_00215, partial [Alphaproteobacteria bacterium]|nr:hypothetical protein [Alphaproteobacteria bacterium]